MYCYQLNKRQRVLILLWLICFQKSFVKSPSGPVIHELDPAEYATALLDTVGDVDGLAAEQSDGFIAAEP